MKDVFFSTLTAIGAGITSTLLGGWDKSLEILLIHETCEALGLSEFDESVFKKAIHGIRIPGSNRLVYVFADGREVERIWRDRSRTESWSPEKRVAQGEQTRLASERRKAERKK